MNQLCPNCHKEMVKWESGPTCSRNQRYTCTYCEMSIEIIPAQRADQNNRVLVMSEPRQKRENIGDATQ